MSHFYGEICKFIGWNSRLKQGIEVQDEVFSLFSPLQGLAKQGEEMKKFWSKFDFRKIKKP